MNKRFLLAVLPSLLLASTAHAFEIVCTLKDTTTSMQHLVAELKLTKDIVINNPDTNNKDLQLYKLVLEERSGPIGGALKIDSSETFADQLNCDARSPKMPLLANCGANLTPSPKFEGRLTIKQVTERMLVDTVAPGKPPVLKVGVATSEFLDFDLQPSSHSSSSPNVLRSVMSDCVAR